MRSRVWQTRAGRLVFIGLDNVFFGIGFFLNDCLDRITDEFFLRTQFWQNRSVPSSPTCA